MKAMWRIFWVVLMAALVVLAACSRGPAQQAETQDETPHALAPAPQHAAAPLSLRLLIDAIGTHGFVLFGEMHGTSEIPALVADFVEQASSAHIPGGHNPIVLALEINSDDQPVVDRYMASNGMPADKSALLAASHWQGAMHDGRDSQAMSGLIERMRQLRHAGADVSIDLFDEPGTGERDKRMADHLRALVQRAPRATVLILTGNVHAMTAAPPGEIYDDGVRIELPMTAGRYLADLHPLSINIDAAGGDAWYCMGRACGVHPMLDRGVLHEATLEASAPPNSAWDATLTLPSFTASPPAVHAAWQ